MKHIYPKKPLGALLLLLLFSATQVFGQITATLTTTTATCQANGTLTVSNVAGGAAPYQVALISGPNVPQPPVFISPNQGGDFLFTGLQSGLHTVSVLDDNGNMKQFSATVPGNYQIMDYTPVPSVTDCNSGTPGTGTITITNLTGGNPPYRYRIFKPTTGAFQSGDTFTGLTPGTTYEVQVFDACDNFQTRQVQIPAIASAGLPAPSTLFEDCDGTVKTTYSATGGNTPYTYEVTAGPNQVGTTNSTGVFSFNTSSSYTVRVTDNCGGTATRTFTTPGKPNQQLFLQGAMGSACDGMGGGVRILARNGIPPYTGTIKGKAGGACASFSQVLNLSGSGNGDYTQTIMGLDRPCMYVVEIKDKCGNTTTEELMLVAGGNEQLGSSQNILCPSGSSTQYRLQMTVSLGPPYSPRANYTFNLFDNNNQPVSGFPRTQSGTSVTVDLPAGTYKYQLSDACGTTTALKTVVIPAYANPTVAVDLTAQCINAGQARLITTSQNPLNSANPAFKITAGPNRVNETNNTGIFSNLTSGGTYTFEFNDGCKRVTTSTTLPPYQQPTFEVAYGVICPPATVATLQAVGIKGTVVQPYQFEIIATNTTGGITRPASTDSTFTNLSAGQYNVRGFDGCNNSFTFLGKIGPIPAPKIQLAPNPVCEGTEFRARPDVFVFGATYTVFRNDTIIYNGPKGINTLPAIAGDYKIKIEVPGGCNATSPLVKLNIVGKLAITNPAEACGGTTVNLTAPAVTAGSSNGTLAYFQDADATVPLDGTTGPANAIKKAGDYYIRLTTTNPSCVTIKKVTVTFKNTPAAPTATPTQPTCTTATGTITVTAPTTGVTYSFNNGTAYQASNVSGSLNPGTYQVRVKGTNECVSAAMAVTLNAQPATPAKPTVNVVQPTCTTPTGIIAVTAPTTGVTYSFDNGANYQASSTSNPLPSGTYQVKVKNAPGCESVATSATINPQPPTPAAPAVSITQPTCTTATGTITVTAPAAGTGITFSFDDGANYQASNASGSLSAGTYQVRVKNAQGCVSAATPATLNAQPPTPVAPAAIVTQPTCTVATGIITVNSPPSATEYSFDNGANYQASNISGPLPAGSYQVRVKNAQGCISALAAIAIDAQPPTPAAPTASAIQPTCTEPTGIISITPPGSDAEYSFDNGTTFQASSTSNPLAAGTYFIKVKNSFGCISDSTEVVIDAQPPTPDAPTVSVTQPTCLVATGTITVTTPASATEYSFDNGANYQSANASDPLPAGDYFIKVKNVEGCVSASVQATLNPQPPTPAAPTARVIQPTCEVATGIIIVTAPPSATEYSFDNGATYQASSSSNPLAAGTYFIKVKNADGCISDSTEVVIDAQPPTPAAPTATVTPPTCEVVTGTITIDTPSTATQYSFDNGTTYQNSRVSDPLPAGDYLIKVKNDEGCISDSTEVVIDAQPATPAAPTATVTQPTCEVATGTITVTAPPSATEYSFDNGLTFQDTNVSPALGEGTYFIKVKNADGCVSDSTEVVINAQPPTPAAPTARVIQPTCDEATGIISITAPLSATTFSFDNGSTFQSSSTSEPLAAGTYSVRVQNSEGCISDSTLAVIDPQPATPATPIATVVQPTCEEPTGTITVTNNTADIVNYSFDNGSIFQADSISPALGAATYGVVVQNADGCFSGTTFVTINPQPATPTLSATEQTCADNILTYTVTFVSDGEVTASLGVVDNLAKTVSGVPANSSVTLTASANGCQRIVIVTAPDCSCPSIAPPVVAVPETTICEGEGIPTFSATVGDRQKAVWYDAPTGGNVLLDGSLTYTPTGAGVFYVEAADTISDCRSTSRVKVELIVNPQPVLTIGEVTCLQSGLFYDVAYTATPGAIVSADQGFVTDSTIEGVAAGTTVKITITLNGCQDSTTVTQNCALPYGSLGDFVFEDKNADGRQDEGEPGIDGVLVYLLSDQEIVLDSTRTDSDGKYGFDSLSTGKYRVRFFLPDGFDGFTKARVPGSDTLDSDADAAGLSQLIDIDTSQDSASVLRNNPTIDAGVTRLGSIGDFVFEDKNNDGVQTDGEPGIPGVTVYLLDGAGTVIDSTLTGSGGKYLFDSLTAGTYQVQFVAPTGYDGFTQPNQGGDPTKDSNAGTDGKSQLITIDVDKAKIDTLRNNPHIDAGVLSPCIQPVISSTQTTAATCDGKTANADARFTLRGLSSGDRYTFASTAEALQPYATATILDADSIQVDGLANPESTDGQTYFVRIYNTRQGCFKDTTVLVPFRDCGSVCVPPQAGPDVFVCKPATTTDLPDALAYEEWVVSPNNKAIASIDSATGVVSGLNESGVYSFILRDKTLESTCADTVVVFRGVLDLPAQTTCEDTLTLPNVAGATYRVAEGTTASITPEGKASGLTAVGTVYRFIVSNGQCEDTISIERLRCTLIYDLALDKAISKKLAMLGDTLTYTIRVFNQGEGVVHGIEVTDSLNAGVQYLGSVAETGGYSFATRKWNFDSLAVGDTATLSINVRIIAQGPWFNTAEITDMTEQDEDSTPGNGTDGEDDIDRECFTVPALICRGQGTAVVFAVPAQYTGVEWFRSVDGDEAVKVGEGNSYKATETELGSFEYTFTSSSGTCPATGCCPTIIVVEDCCPVNVCVPFTLTKKK